MKPGGFMRIALELAWSSAGMVGPRPPVGAVIVKNGHIAGIGTTEKRPGRHAEIVALEGAGTNAKDSTLFCTLEPHSFKGVAPPCTNAIIEAGVKHVIIAIEDPNPAVSGRGIGHLKSAGVEVSMDTDPQNMQDADELIEGFRKHVRTGMPFVFVKTAMSLDGKVSTHTGDAKWITGEEARQRVHVMRMHSDAVVTGIGTIKSDDPLLTARTAMSLSPQPRFRVVVDSKGIMPPSARIFTKSGDILWFTAEDVTPPYIPENARHMTAPRTKEGLDIGVLMQQLGDMGCTKVMVEAGPRLVGSIMDCGLPDRFDVFIAPMLIGGASAPGPVAGKGVNRLTETLSLKRTRIERIGEDFLITGYTQKRIY